MMAPDFRFCLDYEPYGLDANRKKQLMLEAMRHLTQWHARQCPEYQSILRSMRIKPLDLSNLADVPFIPVNLFREFDLISIPKDQVFKSITSSGTSGQKVSRVSLDRMTASFQSAVLSRLVSHHIGRHRLPMLVIDSPSILKRDSEFSARGAAILGFSIFGNSITYALNEDMTLNQNAIDLFVHKYASAPVLLFGFTFVIWQYFLEALMGEGVHLPLNRGVLIHGGGWKRMQDKAIDETAFKEVIRNLTGTTRVINYYGMAEQTGSVHFECEQANLHTSIFSEILIRRPDNLQIAEPGHEGIIEVMSLLPTSYPGHALLTEDIGLVLGEDTCPCGRLGKYFRVQGRLPAAEPRGCGDTSQVT